MEFGTQQSNCVREITNSGDPYAAAVMRNSAVAGLVPGILYAVQLLQENMNRHTYVEWEEESLS